MRIEGDGGVRLLSLPPTMLFLDCETTGLITNKSLPLSDQPRIIEIGAVRTDMWGNEAGAFERIINPGATVVIDPKITEITGLRREDLDGQPHFADVLWDFIEFVRGSETLIAHNLDFDLSMLIFELRRIEWEHRFPYPTHWVDTVPLSAGRKLENWAKEVFDAQGKIALTQEHRALSDVRMLIECWKTLPEEAR